MQPLTSVRVRTDAPFLKITVMLGLMMQHEPSYPLPLRVDVVLVNVQWIQMCRDRILILSSLLTSLPTRIAFGLCASERFLSTQPIFSLPVPAWICIEHSQESYSDRSGDGTTRVHNESLLKK